MSTSYEDLVDPRQEFLDRGWQMPVAEEEKDDPHILLIGMGIAAAIIGIKMIMSHRLAKENPQSPEEARGLAQKIWDANKAVWRKLATPSVTDAYKYGAGALFIPPDQLEKLAVIYVDELGDYFNETSIDALADGFSAQLNSGWAKDLAWKRSTPAYGLDAKQTRSYVITLTDQPKGKYNVEAIPPQSARAIDKAMVNRADRIGINEAYKAKQVGRNTVWMYMEKHGDLQQGSRKKWITARDELVCPTCAPLNGVEIPLDEQFISNGSRFYAPGVHPNCRCEIVLVNTINVVKNMAGDPYDRDTNGRFNSVEMRTARRLPIGTHVSPIGSTRAPIGTMSGPVGWARAPIGQSLPPVGVNRAPIATNIAPIGAEIQPKIEWEPRDKPKIGQETWATVTNKPKVKTKSKVKTKTKVKTPTKVDNRSKVENSAFITTPVKADVQVDYETPAEFDNRKMVIPGMSVLTYDRYDKLIKNGKDHYIWLDGNVHGFIPHKDQEFKDSNVYRAAFNEELSWIIPEVENAWGDKGRADALAMDAEDPTSLATQRAIRESRMPAQGTRGYRDKGTAVMFQIFKPWKGTPVEDAEGDDPAYGYPEGWYKITAIKNENVDAAVRRGRSAFPASVEEDIRDGIASTAFVKTSDAEAMLDQVVYINLERVAYTPPKDKIFKRAPRLLLKRK